MGIWQRRSTVQQFTEFLREELRDKRWTGSMPGVHRLSREFGLNRKTVEAALQTLEDEKYLVSQGPGRRRKITIPESLTPRRLRVAILPHEPQDMRIHYIVDLKHQLIEAGHTIHFSTSSLTKLDMDPRRVARLVWKADVDAWIVLGASREVLEWFAAQPLPAHRHDH